MNAPRRKTVNAPHATLGYAVRALEGLALLVLIYWLGAPPPILVTLGAPQTVHTSNPKMGVHTRLTDEVEEWKIKKTLEMVREMGTPWIVEYFPWGYIEDNEGEFDWAHADLVVDHARQQGLTVIARLGYVPHWARPKDSVTSYLEEARYTTFANFVREFVTHFKGRVQYIVIWNEPNVNLEWGYRPVDPAAYARLLQAVYPIAKLANPAVQVLGGALAPVLASPGATDAMNDLEYLQKMYDAGAKGYFDALAVHAYGWTSPADEPPSPDRVNFRRTELLRDIMVKNGDSAKHVLITEGGWNDHPRWTKAVRPAVRIEDTLSAYDLCKSWDWLDACVMWAFRYPAPAETYQDYFTFVTPDFDPKPIYGSHDAVAIAVQNGTAQAGGLSKPIFESLVERRIIDPAKVHVVAESKPYPEYPWAMRSDLTPGLKEKIRNAYLSLTEKDVLKPFKADGFGAVTDKDYNVIRDLARILNLDLAKI